MSGIIEIRCPEVQPFAQSLAGYVDTRADVVGAVAIDEGRVVYFEGATTAKRPPRNFVFKKMEEGARVEYLTVALEEYRVEVRHEEHWTLFWAYDRRFENRPVYDAVLYTVAPPTKEQIEERLRRAPVPILAEWVPTIAREAETVALIASGNGRSVYRTTLPDARWLEELVGNAAREEAWRSAHGRVPKSSAVAHGFFAPELFRLKPWKEFLRRYGGLEKLEALPLVEVRAVIALFELFGPEVGSLVKRLDRWHAIEFLPLLRDLRKGRLSDETRETLYRGLRVLAEEEESFLEYARSWVAARGRTKKPWKTRKELCLLLDAIEYGEIRDGKVAELCRLAKIPPDLFRASEDLYLGHRAAIAAAPRAIPTLKGETGGYEWEMLDPLDPRWLTVGYETNCCQHIGGAASSCLQYIAQSPDVATCFMVRKKGQHRAVAQSFVWLSKEPTPRMVFDNIEYLGEWRPAVLDCYRAYLRKARGALRALGIAPVALIGEGFMGSCLESLPREDSPAPTPAGIYSDARASQRRLES